MSRLNRFTRFAVMVALPLLLPTLAHAQTKEGSMEIGLSYTFDHFDTQTQLSSRVAPSILLGYNFTKRHGAELVYTSITATPKRGTSFATDVDTLRLGYLFNSHTKPKVVSFFRVGVGVFSTDPEDHRGGPSRLEEGKTSPLIYSGGGLRWFVNPRIGIRLAGTIDFVDAGKGFINGDVQATGDLGVVFLMGGRETVEKPAEEKAP